MFIVGARRCLAQILCPAIILVVPSLSKLPRSATRQMGNKKTRQAMPDGGDSQLVYLKLCGATKRGIKQHSLNTEMIIDIRPFYSSTSTD